MEPGREYYFENYPDYERQNPTHKLDFYMKLVRACVPPGARLHELGVGLGSFLARASSEYVCSGSDVNSFGVADARRRAPNVPIVAGSFEQVPDHPPPDVVVVFDVFEHVPDLGTALLSIRSKLATSGFLILVVPVYDGPLGWLVHRLDRDPTHVRKWSRNQWIGTVRDHGFEIVGSGGILRRLLLGRWYLHLTWPQPMLHRIGSAFWVIGRKCAGQPES